MGSAGNARTLARATRASRLLQHCIPYITQASATQANFLFPILRILEKIEPRALFASSLNLNLRVLVQLRYRICGIGKRYSSAVFLQSCVVKRSVQDIPYSMR